MSSVYVYTQLMSSSIVHWFNVQQTYELQITNLGYATLLQHSFARQFYVHQNTRNTSESH